MSQPAVSALAPLPFELVYSDGEPLETEWHSKQFPFLRSLILRAMAEQGRTNCYVNGDMFVYYSLKQARDIAGGRPYFRGPDVFWVDDVEPRKRNAWVSWEEGGRLPDVIVELLSPSTAKIDRTVKKDLYEQVFQTSEYFLYDPESLVLEGFVLENGSYRPMRLNPEGRLWSDQLQVFLGLWRGVVDNLEDDWLRLFHADGSLVLTEAEAERQRADAECRRAEDAEAEVIRLRALLEKP